MLTENLPITHNLILNIFGSDRYELALDYIQILTFNRAQKLPILVIHGEIECGKSSFIQMLEWITDGDCAYVDTEMLNAKYNGDWLFKRCIFLDGVAKLDETTVDIISNTNTITSFFMESRYCKRSTHAFNGAFILTSNDKSIVDNDFHTAWLQTNVKRNLINLFSRESFKMEVEIFKRLLASRKLSNDKKTRMYFSTNELKTAV